MAKGGTLDLTIKIAGKLDKSLDAAINGAIKQTSLLSKSLQSIGTLGLAGFATITTGLTAGLVKSMEAAKDFESQMASVTKYVEGLADASGKVSDNVVKWDFSGMTEDEKSIYASVDGKTYAENYDTMKDAILRLSTEIPYTAEELTKLAAAAGQSGYGIADLLAVDSNGSTFLRDVAMWGTAMDIDAEQAGDWAAKWEQAFGMTHSQVMELADQINYLGANNATTAAEISTVVNSAASMGQVAGADVDITAALATAILSMGVSSDSASTSIKRMYTNISKGEAATTTQQKAFDMLGLSAAQVAKDMQVNAAGTLIDIFERIGGLDADRQVAALSSLFGQWAIESGAKTTRNLKLFEETLAAVNDSDLYGGSMEREFNIKSDTLEAADIMASNAVLAVLVAAGYDFLGIQKSIAGIKTDFFVRLYNHLPELQTLADSVLPLIEKAMTGIADAIINALPYIQKLVDYIAEDPSGFLGKIGMFLGGSFALTKAPAIEGLVTSAGSGLLDTLLGNKTVEKGEVQRSGGILSALWNGGQNAGSSAVGLLTSASNKFVSGGTNLVKTSADKFVTSQWLKNWHSEEIPGADFTEVPGPEDPGVYDLISSVNWIPWGKEARVNAFGEFIRNQGGSIIDGFFTEIEEDSPLQKIMNAGGKAFGGFSGFWNLAGGGFMALFSGLAPIIGILGTVIALISILGDHLGGLRDVVSNVFGETGLKVFDTFTGRLNELGGFATGLFNGGLADALSGVRTIIVETFGEGAGVTFDSFVGILQAVLGVIGQVVDFGINTVKPIIIEIFEYITGTALPMLLNTFNAVAPYISGIITNLGSAIMGAMNLIGSVIQAAMPIVETVITRLITEFSFAAPMVLSAIEAIAGGISEIVSSLQKIFGGIIKYVTGVFTGDWERAWQGVQDIFGGIFDGLIALVKTPVNAIIGLINGLIDGINSMVQGLTDNAIASAISDFLGYEFSNFQISHLPELASGGFTNGASIAGEAGQEAVISFDPTYRAANIATWLKAGEMLGAIGNNNLVELDEIDGADKEGGTADGTQTWNITYSPQITIQGNADKAALDKALSDAKAEFESWFYQMQKRQARVAY